MQGQCDVLGWWNAGRDPTNKKGILNVLLGEPVEQRLAVYLSCWKLIDNRGRLFIASLMIWLFIEFHAGEFELSSLFFLILNQGSTSKMLLLVQIKNLFWRSSILLQTCFSLCRWDLISFDLWRVITAQTDILNLIRTHSSRNPAIVHNLTKHK